jgi:nucleotide-binding universal stress UspA family protein
MKVLIAIDESPQGKMLIHEIAQRTWKSDTELMLLNVTDLPAFERIAEWNVEWRAQLKAKLKETSDDLLEYASTYLRENLVSSCTVHKASSSGPPEDEIIKVAIDWGADLILLGSHGRHGLAKFFLGSVAESVAVHAPCSVEIVRGEQVQERLQKRKSTVVLY